MQLIYLHLMTWGKREERERDEKLNHTTMTND